MKLCFATHNANKVSEIQKLLLPDYQVISLAELSSALIPETGATLEDNSALKATYVFEKYKIPCFADDTGLEVFSLKGAPGVYSARYAGENWNSQSNMNLLLENLAYKQDRSAQFRTVITFINELGKSFQFEGVVKGTILKERRGSEGFGYDPIFQPDGHSLTFAQMSLNEKNEISHRALAIRKLVKYLKESHE